MNTVVEEQQRRIDEVLASAAQQQRAIDQLRNALIGPKSERVKMLIVADEPGTEHVSAENRAARRRERALLKAKIRGVECVVASAAGA